MKYPTNMQNYENYSGVTMRRRYTFQCLVDVNLDDDVQFQHFVEEIQDYLSNNYNREPRVIEWQCEPEKLVSHSHVRKDMDIL